MAKLAGLAVEGRFSRARQQTRRDALIASAGRAAIGANVRWSREEVLHPYVGFVLGPRHGGRFGFAAPEPVQRRAPDRLIVALVGGSLAYAFAEQSLPALAARLTELPRYRGRAAVSMNLAMAGYKQPQQLMTIAYLQAIGAEFDVVINLDGFNDVTLHPIENAGPGVPGSYPRRWDQRVDGALQGGALRLMLARVNAEQQRASLARAFSRAPLRHSNVANFVHLVLDRRLEAEQGRIDRELLGAPAVPSTGRRNTTTPAELVDLWARSSISLARLVEGDGGRYYHFLQPNQYVPGTKTLSATERAEAWEATQPYRRVVEAGYPLLRRAGATLATRHVRFTDLTGAFATRAETIYVDSCCHVNTRGNEILADLMLGAMRADTETAPAR
jgi:hypothetical protein